MLALLLLLLWRLIGFVTSRGGKEMYANFFCWIREIEAKFHLRKLVCCGMEFGKVSEFQRGWITMLSKFVVVRF